MPAAVDGFEQLLFRLRKVQTGAVAAFESLLVHRHFFTFQFTGNTEDRNHHVGVFCRCNRFGTRLGVIFRPDQLRSDRTGGPLRVLNLEGDLFPLLETDVSGLRRHSVGVTTPCLDNLLAVQKDPDRPAFEAQADAEFAGLRRREKTGPLHPKRIFADGLGRDVRCLQINRGDGSSRKYSRLRATKQLARRELCCQARLPLLVVKTEAGTGSPSLRRNCVPGTKLITASGNSAFRPSSTDTVCVGVPV